MAIETTYTNARANLSRLCNDIVNQRETVIIRRRSGEDVAMVPASELAGLMETAHLLRSPKNRRRLQTALNRALKGIGSPQSVEHLRDEVGL